MDYSAALKYLGSFVDFERQPPGQAGRIAFTLERIKALAERLGHPERRFKSVHIAGTKGKGSTAAFCESVARAAGLRAGTYTSPHLVDVRERIRLDGRPVPRGLLARALTRCHGDYQAVRAAPGDRRLTYFEALTHLAFQIFAEREVDLAVVEVGMGGRLDATNIITPLVSVITAISRDHTAQLGSSLAEIAGEKAGIAKPGVPLLVAPQPPEALEAIRAAAERRGAGPLLVLGQDLRLAPGRRRAGAYRTMALRTPMRTYGELKVRLLGVHQLENAALAVAAMELAAGRGGLSVTEDAVRRGLEKARWPGRFEIARRKPVLTVLDGAHNPDSVRKLMRAIDEEFPRRRPLAVVFAAAGDKDVDAMLGEIAPRAALFVATESGNPRGLDPRVISELARGRGAKRVAAERDIGKALEKAWGAAGAKGAVLVTGSLYLVGRAKKRLAYL